MSSTVHFTPLSCLHAPNAREIHFENALQSSSATIVKHAGDFLGLEYMIGSGWAGHAQGYLGYGTPLPWCTHSCTAP